MSKISLGTSQVLPKSSAHPGSPTSGTYYYNTADNNYYLWDGTSWIDLTAVYNSNTLLLKTPVRVASTANITVSPGGTSLTVDQTVLLNNDRLLLKDQTNAAENGIYSVSGVGTSVVLTRTADAADSASLLAGSKVSVLAGNTQKGTEWLLNQSGTITVGTTTQSWTRTSPDPNTRPGTRNFWTPSVASTTQAIAETVPRDRITTTLSMTTATIYCFGGIVLQAGVPYNFITVYPTTGGTMTGRWAALVRQSDRVVLANAGNFGSGWTANAQNQMQLNATYTPTSDTPVYIAIGTVASVAGVIAATAAATSGLMGQLPALSGTSSTAATTTPPTVGTTLGSLTTLTQLGWATVAISF